jgi:hypothetical protein
MKLRRIDPAFYVLLAIIPLSIIAALSIFAIRAYIVRHSLPLRHPVWSDEGYKGKPAFIERRKFGELLLKAIEIDFGTGVQYLSSTLRAETTLGLPEAYEKQEGGRSVYTYLYPGDPDAKAAVGHKSVNAMELAKCANLTLVYRDDKLRGRVFAASPFANPRGKWAFLSFEDKPLTECTRDDLTGVFGPPTETKDDVLVWYFKPTPPKPGNPIQAFYAHATFNTPEKTLDEIYISLD